MVPTASWLLCRLFLLSDMSWPLHSETRLGKAEQERDMRVCIEQVSVWLTGIASNSLHGRSLDNGYTSHWCGRFTSTVFCAMFSPRPSTLTGMSMSSCWNLGSEVTGDKGQEECVLEVLWAPYQAFRSSRGTWEGARKAPSKQAPLLPSSRQGYTRKIWEAFIVYEVCVCQRSKGAREMVQRLRVFVALAESTVSAPSTHMLAHNHP